MTTEIGARIMKYRFKWNDEQILLVLNRISDDRMSRHDSELFSREVSDAENKQLNWTPNSVANEITLLIQSVCTDRYLATLRSLTRSKKFNDNIDSSATIRLNSGALTKINILTGLNECKNLSRTEIIELALDQLWDRSIQKSVVTTD